MAIERTNLLSAAVIAVAIVASAFYLGVEIQSNTQAIKANTVQNIKQAFADHYSHIIQTPGLADILLRTVRNPENVEPEEEMRFFATLFWMYRAFENAYFSHVDGDLDDRGWRMIDQQMITLVKLPGFKVFWAKRAFWFSDDFRTYVNEEVIPAVGTESYIKED